MSWRGQHALCCSISAGVLVDSESGLSLEALGHRVPVHEISYTHGHMVSGGVGHRVDHEKLLLGRLARDTGDLPAMQVSVQLARQLGILLACLLAILLACLLACLVLLACLLSYLHEAVGIWAVYVFRHIMQRTVRRRVTRRLQHG